MNHLWPSVLAFLYEWMTRILRRDECKHLTMGASTIVVNQYDSREHPKKLHIIRFPDPLVPNANVSSLITTTYGIFNVQRTYHDFGTINGPFLPSSANSTHSLLS